MSAISRSQFPAKMSCFSDLNAVVLDYLTIEGYSASAAKFSKEANLEPQQEDDLVKARQTIQHSIHLGSIQEAIEALNELEPQVSHEHTFLPVIAMIILVHAPLI